MNRNGDNELIESFYNEWEGVRVAAEADIAEYEAFCAREGLNARSVEVLEAWLTAGGEAGSGGGAEGDTDGGEPPTENVAPPP